jgi:hypothetical protein
LTYDPEKWLETSLRSLKDYVEPSFDSDVYDVIFEFPGTEVEVQKLPLAKTLVHFEVDDITNRIIGFGDNIFRDNFDEPSSTIRPQEAKEHRINLDVGIWASDRSGGTTSRMRAYQALDLLFCGSRARRAIWDSSSAGDGGIEIIEFTGGRFLTERTGDIPLYRSVDGQLEIRIYSRTPMGAPEPAVETAIQSPGLIVP